MLPDVYSPPKQQHATGTGVCECVHVNMYTYMSSDQQYVMFKHRRSCAIPKHFMACIESWAWNKS